MPTNRDASHLKMLSVSKQHTGWTMKAGGGGKGDGGGVERWRDVETD